MKKFQSFGFFVLVLAFQISAQSRKSEAATEQSDTSKVLGFFNNVICDKSLSGSGKETKFVTDVSDPSKITETTRNFDIDVECDKEKRSILFNIERNFDDNITQFEDISLFVKNGNLYSSTFGYNDPVTILESTNRSLNYTYTFRNPSNTFIEYKMEYLFYVAADGELNFFRTWSYKGKSLSEERFTVSP